MDATKARQSGVIPLDAAPTPLEQAIGDQPATPAGFAAVRAPARTDSTILLTPRAVFLMASGWMASGWIAAAGVAGMWITAEWKSAAQNPPAGVAAQIIHSVETVNPVPSYSSPIATAGHSRTESRYDSSEQIAPRRSDTSSSETSGVVNNDDLLDEVPTRVFSDCPDENDPAVAPRDPNESVVRPRSANTPHHSTDDDELFTEESTSGHQPRSEPVSTEALRTAVKSAMPDADDVTIESWVEELSGLDAATVRMILEARTRIGSTVPKAAATEAERLDLPAAPAATPPATTPPATTPPATTPPVTTPPADAPQPDAPQPDAPQPDAPQPDAPQPDVPQPVEHTPLPSF